MATGKKYVHLSCMSNEHRWHELVYDFSKDGGAQSTIDLGEADEDMVLLDAFTKVKAAVTSGGAPTVTIGHTDDTNGILQDTLKAALGLGVVLPGDAACKQVKLAKGKKISVIIGTADLTAGKLSIWVKVAKF